MRTISEIACVIRSKNAGPYELTLDIVFADRAIYDRLACSEQISRTVIANLYNVPPEDISRIIWFEPAKALKIVMRRRVISGSPGDADVYGAQQHAPLIDLKVDV